MNFTEIVTEILGMTKRPDKILSIRREVNAAVLYYSSENDYRRDLVETTLAITPAGYELIVDIANDLERFRKVSYMKYGGLKVYIDEVQSLRLTKDCELLNKWYISGDSINIKLKNSTSSLDFGYYKYPPVLTDAAPNYWMLNGNWNAILQRAASVVFNDIGDAQSSQKALALASDAAMIFKSDYIRGNQHDG